MKYVAQNGRKATLMVVRDRTETSGETRTARRQNFEPLINTNNR